MHTTFAITPTCMLSCVVRIPQRREQVRDNADDTATLAHFEAVLRGRADAAAYLTTSFDAQNEDVDITRLR